MPRYYFHIRRGRATILDNHGVDLSDLTEAGKEAARRALTIKTREILTHAASNGAIVVDDEFCTLLEVPL